MHSIQELFFGWVVKIGHFVFPMFSQLSKEQKYCITSLQEKEKKNNLNPHRYYLVYCLCF